MRTLVYPMSVSLDGFIAGPSGDISWTAPDPEQMRFHLDQVREVTAELMGRRLYEDMLVWEGGDDMPTDPESLQWAPVWRAIPKIVFSTTLQQVRGNARLADGDVAAEVARLKAQPGDGVVSVGGAGLAASLIKLDLIDEYRMLVRPVLVGRGTPYFPPLGQQVALELIESRTFSSGVTYLRYRRG
jgi:dihydrofolate reductase